MKRMQLALLILTSACSIAVAENWPRWRGPDGLGVAMAGEYPTEFSAEKNISWKVELPGRGSSTPVVWEDQIILTSPIDGQDGVLSYDFSGKELWRQTFGPEKPGKHRNGTGSNPSPATDGQHIVIYYKSGNVACLTLDGKIRWETNLQDKYGEDTLWWDLGTSPVIAAGNAVIAVMQDGESFLVAMNLESGEVAWKQPRQFECAKESDQSYSTPQVLELDGSEVIVTWGADHLTGHDAKSGQPLWQCGGFNPENKGMWRVIASAASDEEVAVVPYGRGDFLAGIKLQQASGDITGSHRLWERVGLGADVPTPLIHGETIILLTDKGKVLGLNKHTGEQLWESKLPRSKDKYYASPILAGDQLFCAREDGVIMTSTVSDGLENIIENDMGESVIATPIPIRGKLLIRGESHLFLIGE